MSDNSSLSPRASYWRDLKVATVNKVPAARALERDLRRRRTMTLSADCKQRTLANLFWRPAHPWQAEAD